MSRFTQLGDRMFALYGNGDYQGALDLVVAERPHITEDDLPTVEFWRICLLARVGREGDAVTAMSEVLDRGWWYGKEMLRSDSDLDTLHGHPEWEELVAECGRRQAEAAPAAGLFMGRQTQGDGTVVALHAAAGRDTHTRTTWEPVTRLGYDLYAPASSISVTHDRTNWGSIDETDRDISAQVPLGDLTEIIFAGRSRGAVRAAQMATRYRATVGVILVAWAPPVDDCQGLSVPVYVISGDADDQRFLDDIDAFVGYQRALGIPIESDRVEGMGHRYPEGFAEHIATSISWIKANQRPHD
ncbi:MAG: hypothetical protein ABFR95_04645 [Actinomycetota bacterium]